MRRKELKEQMIQAMDNEAKIPASKRHKKHVAGDAPEIAEDGLSETLEDSVSVHLTSTEQSGQVLAILGRKPDSGFVLYGDAPHRIVRRDKRHVFEQHTLARLRGHVARRVNFVRCQPDKSWASVDPSLRVIEDLLSLPEYPAEIPSLDLIKTTPFLTGEGKLIATSGLHPEHRVFLSLDPTLEGMTLPEEISEADIEAAVEVILDPFVDFPLDSGNSANLFGMLFAMVFRECIAGLTPLFVIDANRASTGKGMLVSALSAIAYGCESRFSSGNVDSKEFRKRLTGLAAAGAGFHVLDNVEQVVWSPDLAAFLTAPRWEDRRLGTNDVYDFPNRMIIALTGNHVRVGGDMARRVVLIRLHNEHACPEERSGFTYDPLVPHILRERPNILRAMYTIMAAWHRSGRPVPDHAPRMASFQEWADFSAGILNAAGGYGGLLDNWKEVRGRDSDAEEYTLMLIRGWEHFGAEPFTAKELLGALSPDDIPSCIGTAPNASLSKRMGRLLVRLEGRPFGEDALTVKRAGEENHMCKYAIQSHKTGKKAKKQNHQR